MLTNPSSNGTGAGITAEMFNDDCLGRTSDWLYAHDPTKLFAGIARQARQIFGVKVQQVHVDTSSFSVNGEYRVTSAKGQEAAAEPVAPEAAIIAITYGYSRDHREERTAMDDVVGDHARWGYPLFFQPLDGNSSDKVNLLSAVTALQEQLYEVDGEPSVYVADNGLYSESNMKRLNEAGVKWVSRVSETLTQAKTILQEGSDE